MSLITDPNLKYPDAFYAELLAAHRGLPLEDSHRLNAQLVMILANHVGDMEALREALSLARRP